MLDSAELEVRVRRFAALIRDSFSLCDFLGNTEREVMVGQTLHACVKNLATRGEVFSFRGAGVFRDGPHAANSTAYAWLLDNGLIREESRQAADVEPPKDVPVEEDGTVVVIIPTAELFQRLAAHFELTEEAGEL